MSRSLVIAAAFALAASAEAQVTYPAQIEDLPIPSSFGPLIETALFDDAGGRILTLEGWGEVAPPAVVDFYETSLPALGWSLSPGDGAVFYRGRQRLTVRVAPTDRGTHLWLQLVESNRPAN